MPTTIEHIVSMGDSLSDRGTLKKRRLFGIIPMDWFSGLRGHSPMGRFTNGLVWTDYLAAMIADDFIVKDDAEENAKAHESDTLAWEKDHGQFLAQAKTYQEKLQDHAYTLSDDLRVTYKGHDFLRSYDEGGLTAKSYFGKLSYSVSRFFSRLVLATLGSKRKRLLDDDEAHSLNQDHKDKTLVIEWSGANDLITVNDHPSNREADDAITARLNNIRQMVAKGYKNFRLFDMPDLSITPRYAKYKGTHQNHKWQRAHDVSEHFNSELKRRVAELKQELDPSDKNGLNFDVFEVNETLGKIYEDPEAYGFNPKNKTEPYIKSDAFGKSKNHRKDCCGHMFWDDVHPCERLHAILAREAYKKTHAGFNFAPPTKSYVAEAEHDNQQQLLQIFIHAYERKFHHDKHHFGSSFRHSRIESAIKAYKAAQSHTGSDPFKTLSLKKIMKHALVDGGDRTKDVLQELNWINSDCSLKLNNPVLKAAHKTPYQERLDEQLIHMLARLNTMR